MTARAGNKKSGREKNYFLISYSLLDIPYSLFKAV